jgi:hypothetical protein
MTISMAVVHRAWRALHSSRRSVAWHSAIATALSLGGAAPVVSGCVVSERSCTDIGCSSSVIARLSEEPAAGEAKHVRVCVNERCLEVDYTPGSPCVGKIEVPILLRFCVRSSSEVSVEHRATLGQPFADGDTFDLSIENASGEEVVSETRQLEYREFAPAGRDCGPVCLESSFDL